MLGERQVAASAASIRSPPIPTTGRASSPFRLFTCSRFFHAISYQPAPLAQILHRSLSPEKICRPYARVMPVIDLPYAGNGGLLKAAAAHVAINVGHYRASLAALIVVRAITAISPPFHLCLSPQTIRGTGLPFSSPHILLSLERMIVSALPCIRFTAVDRAGIQVRGHRSKDDAGRRLRRRRTARAPDGPVSQCTANRA